MSTLIILLKYPYFRVLLHEWLYLGSKLIISASIVNQSYFDKDQIFSIFFASSSKYHNSAAVQAIHLTCICSSLVDIRKLDIFLSKNIAMEAKPTFNNKTVAKFCVFLYVNWAFSSIRHRKNPSNIFSF